MMLPCASESEVSLKQVVRDHAEDVGDGSRKPQLPGQGPRYWNETTEIYAHGNEASGTETDELGPGQTFKEKSNHGLSGVGHFMGLVPFRRACEQSSYLAYQQDFESGGGEPASQGLTLPSTDVFWK
jgi:hypothetical protein